MFDKFTIVAQMINFLILVVLLKFFLYDRILKAAADREKKIADLWAAGQKDRAAAAAERAKEEAQRAELEQHREDLMKKVQEEVDRHRDQVLERLHDTFERERKKWRRGLEEEHEVALRHFAREAAEQLHLVARQVMADLADGSLEAAMVRRLIREIQRQEPEGLKALAQSGRIDGGRLKIRSGFDLSPEARDALIGALRERASLQDIQPDFETDPALVCGLEIKTPSFKIAWNIADYLDALREKVGQAIDQESSRTEAEGVAKSESSPGKTPAGSAEPVTIRSGNEGKTRNAES